MGHGYGLEAAPTVAPRMGLDDIRQVVNFDTPVATIMGAQQQQEAAVAATLPQQQQQQQQQGAVTFLALQQTGMSALLASIHAAYGGAATAAANVEMVACKTHK